MTLIKIELTTDELSVVVACVGLGLGGPAHPDQGARERVLARSPKEVTEAVVDKLCEAMREAIGS